MHILVVDDQPIFCRYFCKHLEETAKSRSMPPVMATSVYTLADAISAVGGAERPDLVFLDLGLDSENQGTVTLQRFRDGNPHKVPVVIFTGLSLHFEQTIDILRYCISVKPRGLLLKLNAVDDIDLGLARIFAGQFWCPQDVIEALAANPPAPRSSDDDPGLTERQWEVMKYLARGDTDKDIARELDITPPHVRQIVTRILKKLGVRNRTQAALAFYPETRKRIVRK
jgi:two-component system, NarL family, nitrate/nitrite response regulator NarL